MIDVYILLTNEFRFLDIQVQLIRHYVKDINNIYGVMGPVGTVGPFKNNQVKTLSIDSIIIPPDKKFLPPKQIRVSRIINYLMENYVDKRDIPALFLHADVFPISDFIIPEQENIVARGAKNQSNFAVTWAFIKPTHRLIKYYIDKGYPGFFPQGDRFKKIFGIDQDGLNIEWCAPSFIHTDDSSRNELNNPELSEKKLEFLKKYIAKKNMSFDESVILPQDLISLTKRYVNERKKWIDAGKPLRSPEEIDRIFQVCQACPFFLADSSAAGSCTICGCGLKKRGKTMNKIAWATTECPKTPSEWLQDKEPKSFDKNPSTPKKCCGG